MSVSEKIKKLMQSENVEDKELAIFLLESDKISFEEKKEFIEHFLKKSPESFSKEEIKLLRAWLDLSRKNAENLIKNRIQKF